MLSCPECGEKFDKNEYQCNYSWMLYHVWDEHRRERKAYLANDKGCLLLTCPWCYEEIRCLNDDDKAEERHLSQCLPYIATCLSGVRQGEGNVNMP